MIDRDGPQPLYRQIAALLACEINAGRTGVRERLPSEADLRKRFGISRGTARRAVAELRGEGLVFTVPQRGTYTVASSPAGTDAPR